MNARRLLFAFLAAALTAAAFLRRREPRTDRLASDSWAEPQWREARPLTPEEQSTVLAWTLNGARQSRIIGPKWPPADPFTEPWGDA